MRSAAHLICACMMQRKECKDIISMYTCSNWALVHQFPVATSDLEDIAWSPDCACLVAWDTCLTYKLVVCTPQGEVLTTYSAYPNALGIKSVEWSPSGQMLAVGSFDQVLLQLSATQQSSACLSVPACLCLSVCLSVPACAISPACLKCPLC